MMGMTHIFIGTASAMAVSSPHTVSGCFAAMIGGAAGGFISDIDMKASHNRSEAVRAGLIAAGIAILLMTIDCYLHTGICNYILEENAPISITGLCLFVGLCVFGAFQDHRGFTHSLLAMALFSLAVGIFYKPFLLPFATGFLSHLVLDLLNRKPIKLLFPLDTGLCLKLCYANRLADRCLLAAGIVITIFCLARFTLLL